MRINPHSRAFVVLLGALSAIPPISIDMGLPGITAIESAFPDAANRGALTLSLFLLGFAGTPMIAGPLADRFGRRPAMLAGLALLSLGAAACAVAPDFTVLLACRLLQGIGAGVCVALPLTMIRDLFDGAAARVKLSHVTAVLGLSPLLAPVLGGWVMSLAGWRAIFAAQGAMGLVLLAVAFFGVAETRRDGHRRSLRPRQIAAGYATVLSNGRFLTCSLIFALSFGAVFAYISSSSAVLMEMLGLSENQFSLAFACTAMGVIVGSVTSGAVSRRGVSSGRILAFGITGIAAAAVVLVALSLTGHIRVVTLIPVAAFMIFCFAMSAPAATQEALQPLPHVAGMAAGVARSIQMALGALVSGLVAAFMGRVAPDLTMALLTAACAALLVVVFVVFRFADQGAAAELPAAE